MSAGNFIVDIEGDGIVLVTWDMPGRSMNVIDAAVIDELFALVEKVATDAAIGGAIITSGKASFCAGADLADLARLVRDHAALMASEGEAAANARLFEQSRKFSLLCRRIETCGKPWVAALNGTALGGGFELALACHCRIAADDDRTRVGLPEVKIGLFPGGGGTQRVARILPPSDALQFLLRGDQISVDRAKALKLIDMVVTPGELIKAAKSWIVGNGGAKAPWDTENFKPSGGPVHSKAGMMVFAPANAIYRRQTYDNYPAARAIIQVVYEGLQLPMDQALRVESRYFAKILRSPEAAAMTRTLFLSLHEINKGARRPADIPTRKFKSIGVLGAGFMGAGIAYMSALAGFDVVLLDRDPETAERGKAHAQRMLAEQNRRGRASQDDHALLARIEPTADFVALKNCDLVIEAVFEDRTVKDEVLSRVQNVLRDQAVLASNTSTLPITSLAEALKDRSRFIGIHFFSPVERMNLVEIILGKETGAPALAAAIDYVRAIGKTPIVVNDARGFYTSRVVGSYLREGHLMLQDGVPPALIDNAGRMAGMPVGPLALTDEVAIDLAWKILKATEADLGPHAIDARQKALLQSMVEKHGRLGRKNSKGFYDYPSTGPKRLWPGLSELQSKQLDPNTLDVGELKQRLLAIQALETARCVEEGVIVDMREADVGSILGFGFAPFTGGTISYIDRMGTAAFVELCGRLAQRHGERFRPGKLLLEMAKGGDTFYRRFAPAPRKAVA